MRIVNPFRRKSLAFALVLTVAAVTLLAPAAQADLPVPTPRLPFGVHAVIDDGLSPTDDGACAGTFSVTTDRPVPQGVFVRVMLQGCVVTSSEVVSSPNVPLQAGTCEVDGCVSGEDDHPNEAAVWGHAEWDTQSCEENCGPVSSLLIDNYQSYHTSGAQIYSDGSATTCATTGQYHRPYCETLTGQTQGSQLSMIGKGTATIPHATFNGDDFTLTGYMTMYTYPDGTTGSTCSYSGNAGRDTNQIFCA